MTPGPTPPPPPDELDDTIAELDRLVTFLRRRGVVTYEEGPDFRKLTILPNEPPLPPIALEPEEVKEVDKPAEPEKLGKDGLSREMQTELYGRPMPDWE